MNKKAFTLVELIVVITILAILWTIAFISLQWYSKDARDSTRVSDINSINISLNLYETSTWKFPEPSLGTAITFSWAEVWTQWTVWSSVISNLTQLSKIPTDPKTESEYTYSVLNTKKEYQLAAVMEWKDVSFNTLRQANAAWEVGSVYIEGNYNWIVAKVSTGSVQYILAIPSLISWDVTEADVVATIQSNNLVLDWSQKLPSNYLETTFTSDNTSVDYTPADIVVYNGTTESLANIGNQVTLLENIKAIYTDTSVPLSNSNVNEIVTLDTLYVDNTTKLIASSLVNNTVSSSIPLYTTPAPVPFISTWNINWVDAWVSWVLNLRLPLKANWIYDFSVDWGDGNSDIITSYNQAEATHSYTIAWTYTVTITWTINGFWFWWLLNENDAIKIIDINQWWDLKLSNWWAQFFRCNNLTTFSAIDEPDLLSVTDMNFMFAWTPFNGDISWWDVSRVTNMSSMFKFSSSFNQDISWWNVSNVTNMTYLLYWATSFNKDLSWWDVSNVTLYGMYDLNTPAWLLSKPSFGI